MASLDDPIARAIYMMFLVSEVRPSMMATAVWPGS